MNSFTVRPLEQEDIQKILDYWHNADPQDLERMGVDVCKLPSRKVWYADFEDILRTPVEEASTFYLVWLFNGRSIGFNSLKNILKGTHGEMHLHIWDRESRGKGYGAPLFCLSALEFYERFQLENLYCEPRSTNPFPNRLLRKIGFPLVKTYTAASSELALVCELNRYQIVRNTAEFYLRSHGFSPSSSSASVPYLERD